MTGEQPEQGAISGVNIPDYMKPLYANYVSVNHTPWDFRLTFSVVKAPVPGPEREEAERQATLLGEAVADLMIPASLMHGLISALTSNFDTYIKQYGPPGLEPEGPQPQVDE